MHKLYSKPIVTAQVLKNRINELGSQISKDYMGKDLVMIGVLKGAYLFFADLTRAVTIPVTIDFLVASSYGMRSSTQGHVDMISNVTGQVKGKHVILVEDIVDSGTTISFLVEKFGSMNPESIKVCTLLDKSGRRKKKVQIDYSCFNIDNRFVVGYGLDYQNQYRNLPYIAALEVDE